MPDKTHIQRAAEAIHDKRKGFTGRWADMELVFAEAALSTTLEPSEAEIAKATLAFNVFFHGVNNVIEEEDPAWRAMMEAMRAALVAAARVRVGE